MKHRDINEIILQPALLQGASVEGLDEMLARYPYCLNLHFLAVKKHLQVHSPLYKKRLHRAATYAVDRSQLYDWLYPSRPLLHTEEAQPATEELDYEEVAETAPSQTQDLAQDIDQRLNHILGQQQAETPDQKLEEAILRIRNMRLGRTTSTDATAAATNDDDDPSAVFELLSKLEQRLELELEPQDLLGPIEDTTTEQEASITFLEMEADEEINDPDGMKRIVLQRHIDKLRQSVDAFFKLDQTAAPLPEETEGILDGIPADMSFKEWMQSLKQRYETHGPSQSHTADQRIDHSVEEDDEMMSEALAAILASQGNLERAIRMYEQLILKFPEKKAFFAQKINELKQ